MRTFRPSTIFVWLASCLLMAGMLALVGHGQGSEGAKTIWCLFDADDTWDAPPFEDVLLVLTSDGMTIKYHAQFGTDSGLGGMHPLAALPEGGLAVLAEQLSGRVGLYTLAGEPLWSLDEPANSANLLSTGSAYVLTDSGSISGKSILLVDLDSGSVLKEAPFGGVHLAVDEGNGAVWVVGDNIKRMSLDLELDFMIDPITWAALCVDTTSDGSAWIGEALYTGMTGSQQRMLKVSSAGMLVNSVELKGRPYAASVDLRDDSVWVATSNELLKLDAEGNPLVSIDSRTYSVCVDPEDGSLWAAHPGGVIVQYSAEGEPLLTVTTGISGYCWISLPGS